jgi:monoamine oxidase
MVAGSTARSPDVLVVGGGMAGVTAARSLTRAGLLVRVLEARRRLGGRIHTVRDFCSAPVEAGAELIHGRAAKTWPDVRAAGLHVRPSPHMRGAMMNLGGGARWLQAVLANPEVWPAFSVLRRIARAACEPADLSAAKFVQRRGYQGRARLLAEMALSAHPPGELKHIGLQGFVSDGILRLQTGTDFRVNEGYDRLIQHIAGGVTVEYEFVVSAIRWSRDGVTVESADNRTIEAPVAIVTLPAGVLQRGSIRFIPELPQEKTSALAGIVSGPVTKVLLLFQERFWPRGMSALLCGVGPVTLYWNVFYGLSADAAVLTAYCTGPRARALNAMSEAEALERIIADLRYNFRRSLPRLLGWRRIDWSSDPFACGGYSFLRPGAAGARAELAAPTAGKLFWAGSETATAPIAATVEGAFTSGLRAADEVLAALGRHHGASL